MAPVCLQDVFELGGKIVILTSTQGLNGWTQFWVGEMSDDDLTFKSGAENPFLEPFYTRNHHFTKPGSGQT